VGDEMKAGRELNHIVIQHVMMWKFHNEPYDDNKRTGWYDGDKYIADWDSFKPSTNISDVWQVVEKFDDISVSKDKKEFHCEIVVFKGNIGRVYEAYAETAPLAIVKASLKAKGVEIE
jgi:hypothetical protein